MRYFIAIALLLFVSHAGAVTLVQDGEPAAVIVLGKQPHPVAFEAAIELQRVLQRISGAKLPIYLENEFHNGHEGPRRFTPRIFVGESQSAREAGLDLSDLPPEGFKIIQTSFSPVRPSPETHHRPPKNTYTAIILAGRDEDAQTWMWRGDRANRHTRGTAYAVYNFLENDLGVRWLWPGDLGEVVPQLSTVTVNVKNRSDAPKLPKRIVRNYFGYSIGSSWQGRGKLGGNFGVFTRLALESDMWLDHMGLGDSLPKYSVATEGRRGWEIKFGKDHPDWFAMQSDGSRLTKELFGRVRICLANPQVIDQIVKEADDFFKKHPDKIMYGIELSDVWGSYCQCNLCKAWGPTTSDLVARHWKAIGERILKIHPDKLLYAHPYHTYIDPPTNVHSLPDNIVLFPVGQNMHGYTAEPDRQRSIKSWLGWAKLNNQKMIWRPNFGGNDVGYPVNYAHRIAADIKLFYQNKMMGTDIDHLRRLWAGSGLTYYVYHRLFWDPTRDVDAMISDYCEKGFGPAAKQIQAYFNYVEKLTTDIANKVETGFHPMGLPGGQSGSFGLATHYTPAITKKMHDMLDAAVSAAGDDAVIKQRIAFLRKAVEYVQLEHNTIIAGQQANKQDLTQDQIDKLQAMLDKRFVFIKNAAGKNYMEAEVAIRGSEWIDAIIKEQKQLLAGIDDFSDLWLANDYVTDLPLDWKFKTDPNNTGEKNKWAANNYNDANWQPIKIAEFWDVQGHREYNGLAWYRRKIKLPASLKGKTVLAAFGAVDEIALIYIDGQLAATHDDGPMGWDKRFVVDLTKHIKPGVTQTWAIRVMDTTRAGGIWKPVKIITPKPKGQTQTLSLEPTADAYTRLNFPDTPHGKSPSLAVGSKDYFRSYLAWELPASLKTARIRSAKIILALRYVKKPGSYDVHPFPTTWRERTITWNQRNANQLWPKGGGNSGGGNSGGGGKPRQSAIATITFDHIITAQQTEKASTPTTFEIDVSKYMHTRGHKTKNFGIIILQKPLDPQANFSPHSREAKEKNLRPRLVIEYELK